MRIEELRDSCDNLVISLEEGVLEFWIKGENSRQTILTKLKIYSKIYLQIAIRCLINWQIALINAERFCFCYNFCLAKQLLYLPIEFGDKNFGCQI